MGRIVGCWVVVYCISMQGLLEAVCLIILIVVVVTVGLSGPVLPLPPSPLSYPPSPSLSLPAPQVGADIVKRSLVYPLKLIAKNAGVNGSVVVEKVSRQEGRGDHGCWTAMASQMRAKGEKGCHGQGQRKLRWRE